MFVKRAFGDFHKFHINLPVILFFIWPIFSDLASQKAVAHVKRLVMDGEITIFKTEFFPSETIPKI